MSADHHGWIRARWRRVKVEERNEVIAVMRQRAAIADEVSRTNAHPEFKREAAAYRAAIALLEEVT